MVTSLEAAAWVLAVVAGASLLLSTRTPQLGSRPRWVFRAAMQSVLERRDGGALGGDGVPG
jgi:hypothetical protein